ncbi:MAG TPA: (2Fe-2S)-binding protein [Alphaproteobacteria bacterium]|nr:(2Fe-2S)-binding protein [Alphaproteobacteria bacterium]
MSAFILNVNGSQRQVEAAGDATLLTVLRDGLELTGAKRGCNQGVCGACTVALDGAPVRACLSIAANCEGQEIVTVEGLARDPIGAALRKSFAECGAVQCGFCTPGMLMAARRLLADGLRPDTDQIRAGLSGNLCRCSGYRKIVDAVHRAAEALAP